VGAEPPGLRRAGPRHGHHPRRPFRLRGRLTARRTPTADRRRSLSQPLAAGRVSPAESRRRRQPARGAPTAGTRFACLALPWPIVAVGSDIAANPFAYDACFLFLCDQLI